MINTTDHFGQHGATVAVRWARYPTRTLAVGAKVIYRADFARYLAPGVHLLHLSVYGDSSAAIWLR